MTTYTIIAHSFHKNHNPDTPTNHNPRITAIQSLTAHSSAKLPRTLGGTGNQQQQQTETTTNDHPPTTQHPTNSTQPTATATRKETRELVEQNNKEKENTNNNTHNTITPNTHTQAAAPTPPPTLLSRVLSGVAPPARARHRSWWTGTPARCRVQQHACACPPCRCPLA
jgi:hypothetical protein